MTGVEGNPFHRVAIVGLGLMGGSLARALKGLPDPPHIRASSLDPEDIESGLAAGAIDEGVREPSALLRDRDLLVYATPLRATIALLEEHRPHLESGTIVTDLVSLKVPLLARALGLGLEDRYVGSHPMVGGTGSGFGHASPDLYRGGRVWLVAAGQGVSSPLLRTLRAFWGALGAKVAEITARDHDEAMVWLSHLPQLTSNALALAMKRAGFNRDRLGSGGRDMTRLAGSAPEMWKDLLEAAPESLPEALQAVERELAAIRTLLLQGDTPEVARRMVETRAWVEEDS
ncbi:MAG: prephenate dehydrogenase [Longimicrobiales bacterium]